MCCRNRIIETRRLLRGSGYWFYENHVVKSTSRFSLEEEEGEKKQKLGFAAEDLSCQKRPWVLCFNMNYYSVFLVLSFSWELRKKKKLELVRDSNDWSTRQHTRVQWEKGGKKCLATTALEAAAYCFLLFEMTNASSSLRTIFGTQNIPYLTCQICIPDCICICKGKNPRVFATFLYVFCGLLIHHITV